MTKPSSAYLTQVFAHETGSALPLDNLYSISINFDCSCSCCFWYCYSQNPICQFGFDIIWSRISEKYISGHRRKFSFAMNIILLFFFKFFLLDWNLKSSFSSERLISPLATPGSRLWQCILSHCLVNRSWRCHLLNFFSKAILLQKSRQAYFGNHQNRYSSNHFSFSVKRNQCCHHNHSFTNLIC